MNDDNLLIVCRSCGRKVLMHNMKPDASGENMICFDCAKKQGVASERLASLQKPESARPKSTITEKMIKYICTACKYKFSRKESRGVDKCPYCGKNSIVLDSDTGAEKLLKESTNKKFETW